jgi:hypothetical protein
MLANHFSKFQVFAITARDSRALTLRHRSYMFVHATFSLLILV